MSTQRKLNLLTKKLNCSNTIPISTLFRKTKTYLKLPGKPRDATAGDGLLQVVHLDPQPSSWDVCLPTSDELIEGIMDEHILGLYCVNRLGSMPV